MNLSTVTPNPDLSLQEQFAHAAAHLKAALKAVGKVYLTPRPEKHFFSLTRVEQDAVLIGMHNWADVILGYIEKGGSPKNTRNITRYYLNKLGVQVPQDFIAEIQDGDIVEIYGSDAKRLFFNPEVFDFSSYPSDMMFSCRWWDLYERDTAISCLINEYARSFYTGDLKKSIKPKIPLHTCGEKASDKLLAVQVDLRLLAPVTVGDTIIGVAALETFKML